MKYFLVLTVAFIALAMTAGAAVAQQQTPVSKETANSYYQNCVSTPSGAQQFSKEAQQMLCGCTAARMTQFFTMQDMQRMVSTDPAVARPAFNKMLINVYSPCMEYPTFEYHYRACMDNPETRSYGNPAKICKCMATRVADHMKIHGPEVFAKLLANNPNMTDPMSAMVDDMEFQNFARSQLLSCLQ